MCWCCDPVLADCFDRRLQLLPYLALGTQAGIKVLSIRLEPVVHLFAVEIDLKPPAPHRSELDVRLLDPAIAQFSCQTGSLPEVPSGNAVLDLQGRFALGLRRHLFTLPARFCSQAEVYLKVPRKKAHPSRPRGRDTRGSPDSPGFPELPMASTGYAEAANTNLLESPNATPEILQQLTQSFALTSNLCGRGR